MRLRKIELLQSPRGAETKNAAPEPPRRRRRWWPWVAVPLLLAGLAGGGWALRRPWVTTTGRVVARQAYVTAPAAAAVATLHVREGDRVAAGQTLATLESDESSAQLDRLEARLAEVRAHLEAAEATGVDPASRVRAESAQRDLELARERERKAAVEVEQAELARKTAVLQAERKEKLFLLRAGTREEWEDAAISLRKAEADERAAAARVAETRAATRWAEKILEAERVAGTDAVGRVRTEVKLLENERQIARAKRARLEVKASAEGVVSWISVKAGDLVKPGEALLTLTNPREMWVEAYVSGSDLTDLREGQEAWVKVGGGSEIRGHASLIPAAAANGDRGRRVGPQEARSPSDLGALYQPVRITFDPGAADALRPEIVVSVRLQRQ